MGKQTKINNGNYMGDQENHQKISLEKEDRSGSKSDHKRGSILKGLPGIDDRSPKAGYPAPPNFQDMRNQDPAKGRI